jgi:hypothetical protein
MGCKSTSKNSETKDIVVDSENEIKKFTPKFVSGYVNETIELAATRDAEKQLCAGYKDKVIPRNGVYYVWLRDLTENSSVKDCKQDIDKEVFGLEFSVVVDEKGESKLHFKGKEVGNIDTSYNLFSLCNRSSHKCDLVLSKGQTLLKVKDKQETQNK